MASTSITIPQYLPKSSPLSDNDSKKAIDALKRAKENNPKTSGTIKVNNSGQSPSKKRAKDDNNDIDKSSEKKSRLQFGTLEEFKKYTKTVTIDSNLAVATIPEVPGSAFIVSLTSPPAPSTSTPTKKDENKELGSHLKELKALLKNDVQKMHKDDVKDYRADVKRYSDINRVALKLNSDDASHEQWSAAFRLFGYLLWPDLLSSESD